MPYAFSLFFHSNCIFFGILSHTNSENLEEIKIYKIVTIYLNLKCTSEEHLCMVLNLTPTIEVIVL
jgi:hypothetical protein